MQTVLLLKSDYVRAGGPETLLRNLVVRFDRDRVTPVIGIVRRAGEAAQSPYPDRVRQVQIDWRGFANLLRTARAVAALAREVGADVIHSHDMRTNLLAATMRLYDRRPWIAHVHGWLGPTHRGKWRVFEAVDRRLIRLADLVLVGSRAAQHEARQAGARLVHLVPNAVAVPADAAMNAGRAEVRAEIGAPDGRVVLGMLGRLHPGKGQEFFLRALANLRAQGKDVAGLVVGEGPDADRLAALAAELGISDRIFFTGFVADAIRFIPAMDVAAVPSVKDSLPLTALELMAHGRAVVVSETGDLPVAVADGVCGFVVPVGDVGALTERLGTLVDDVAMRNRFGAAARQRILDLYSVEAMARALEDQYRSLLAPAAG